MEQRETMQEMTGQENDTVQTEYTPVAESETVPRRKKGRKIAILCAAILCGAIALWVGYTMVLPAVRYQIGVDRLEKGEYAEALEQLTKLQDYKDAAELIREAELGIQYDRAGELVEREKFEDAWTIYEELGDYKDSRELVTETKYLYGRYLSEQREYEAARTIYEELGDYKDSRELVTEMKYLHALYLSEQEQWQEARKAFLALGDYKDSAERAEHIRKEIAYESAVEWYEKEEYQKAYDLFRMLGTFRDAEQRAEEAGRLYEIDTAYREAQADYRDGYWLDAYYGILKIAGENYKDANELPEKIIAAVEEEIAHYADGGETVKMLSLLRQYEEIDEQRAKELGAEIIAQGVFEPDDSHYSFKKLSPITTFTKNTTTEQFAILIMHMYLNGKTSVTLWPQGTVTFSEALTDELADRLYFGSDMVDELLSTHASIYNPDMWVEWVWEGDTPVFYKMIINLENEGGYSASRLKSHVMQADAFCEESVRKLIEVGLLRNNMSHQQKAVIINEWVAYYLTYDDSLEIHNAGVAVEKKLGVCESYAALFNRMCNLAGVPTWGQIGDTNEGHVWSIHLDENGNIFRSDSTWSDNYDIDFSKPENGEPTVEQFCIEIMDCFEEDLNFWKGIDKMGRDNAYGYTSDYYGGYGGKLLDPWPGVDTHMWSPTLWDSHKADRSPEEIVAFYESRVA